MSGDSNDFAGLRFGANPTDDGEYRIDINFCCDF
jgi:hypothetical protein